MVIQITKIITFIYFILLIKKNNTALLLVHNYSTYAYILGLLVNESFITKKNKNWKKLKDTNFINVILRFIVIYKTAGSL